MSNQIIGHVEIPALDLERAVEFYQKVFDWDFKQFGRGYYLYNTRSGMTIGLRKAETIQAGNSTIFHVTVDNIDSYLDKVKTFGGKVFREKTVIPVYGWYALLNDPDGNILGLFQTH
jgi:hypothetical protein